MVNFVLCIFYHILKNNFERKKLDFINFTSASSKDMVIKIKTETRDWESNVSKYVCATLLYTMSTPWLGN